MTSLPPAAPSPTGRHDAALGGAALLLILGSVLFLGGGRAHPAVGGLGGAEFFHAFAATVRHTPEWRAMHMLVLVGPLLWAVGAPLLLDALRPDARVVTAAARATHVIAATLWGVAFDLDGFGAPVYADALARSTAPELVAALTTSFAANAVMMSRLGLVSWVAGGLAMATLASLLLARRDRSAWRIATGASGIVLGLWPLVAAFEGEYGGGPFTSPLWRWNALAVGLWYLALSACAWPRRREAPALPA